MHDQKRVECPFIVRGDDCNCSDNREEMAWRIASQRKAIDGLRADKLALMEMLERTREYVQANAVEFIDAYQFDARINDLLERMRG